MEFGGAACASLTDNLLKSFLMRVNAKRHSTTVTLHCCSQVCGSGLAPLRDSTVLKLLDLRNANVKLDMAVVDSLLGGFLPSFETIVLNGYSVLHESAPIRFLDGSLGIQHCAACRQVSTVFCQRICFFAWLVPVQPFLSTRSGAAGPWILERRCSNAAPVGSRSAQTALATNCSPATFVKTLHASSARRMALSGNCLGSAMNAK